jgi:hypothetical protein
MTTEEKKVTGNKGEWSELYVLMKLLSQGTVHAANEKLEKIQSVYYPITKVLREENKGIITEYAIEDEEIVIKEKTDIVGNVRRKELEEYANRLFQEITKHHGSFELREILDFANGIRITKIKAPSKDTSDIVLEIKDIHTSYIRDVGFSIKSEIGHSPTLMNAGQSTNFIYKVTGITSIEAENINAINTRTKIKDRIASIYEKGGDIQYVGMNHKVFQRNLIMIDSYLPQILGQALLYYFNDEAKECNRLVELLEKRDPLNYGCSELYTYKFKKFLCSCALGMKPATEWDGLDEASGGYLIVKEDGEILAYHIYNRNFFEQYLLDNTEFDKGSTTRHDYMNLYEENGEMFIKMNLQVRFRKYRKHI